MERATLTAKEAAAYIGCSYWLLLEMVKRKEINCIHAGNRVLFRRSSIDNWMANQEAVSTKVEVKEGYSQLRRLQG